MSLIGLTFLAYEISSIYQQVFVDKEHGYNLNEIFYTSEQMHSFDHLTLGSLNNSANFIFGLTGGDLWTAEFDVMNNPYVEAMGLEMANGGKIEFHHR